MNQIAEIAQRHEIGNPGDYVSVMHAGIASRAAAKIATIEEQTAIGMMEEAYLRRMAEVLHDTRYIVAVSKLESGLLDETDTQATHYFRPQVLNS